MRVLPYNNYITTMKKVLEKAGWFCANCVMWGLMATLGWGLLLAIGNVCEASWVQWLLP